MLILTRRPGQSIIIGDDIIVTISAVAGNQVRVGIQAPANIRIDREEIRALINLERGEDAEG